MNQENGRKQYWPGDDPAKQHIIAACAEKVIAKIYNVYWDGNVGKFHAPDLPRLLRGWEVEVRYRPFDPKGEKHDLMVRGMDKVTSIYFHTIARLPHFRVVGWMVGAEAKRSEYWKDELQCWCVPSREVRKTPVIAKEILWPQVPPAEVI